MSLGGIGRIVGAVAGAYLGGPSGAMMGAQLGGSLGGRRGGGGGGMQNPAEASAQYLNQVQPTMERHLLPYAQGRQASDANSMEAYNRILNQYTPNTPESQIPMEFLQQLERGYRPSEGYRFKEGRMLSAARNSAASGGFAGTHFDQENQANTVRGLLEDDLQSYLDRVLGIAGTRGAAIGDIGRHHEMGSERAFNASNALAGNLGSNLSQQAGLAFQGANQNNANNMARRENRNQMFGNLAGMLGQNMPGGFFGQGGFGGFGGGNMTPPGGFHPRGY